MKKLLSLALALCMLLSLAPAALAEEALPTEDPAAEVVAEAPAEAVEPEVPQDEPADEPIGAGALDGPQEEPAADPSEDVTFDAPQEDPAEEPVEDNPAEEPDDADEEESVSTEAAAISVAPSDEPPENGWYNDGDHVYYFRNGEKIYGIQQIDGIWYYFGKWMLDDSEYQLVEGKGESCRNIRAHAGGALYQNEWYQRSDGKWQYYGNDFARVIDKFIEIDHSWYYLDQYGNMLDNDTYGSSRAHLGGVLYQNEWYEDEDGIKYYKNDLHYAINEILEIAGNYYYFLQDGNMLNNARSDTRWPEYYSQYRAHEGGVLFRNEWYEESGARYYYSEDCIEANGFMVVGDVLYYFTPRMLDDNEYQIDKGDSYTRAHIGGRIYQNEWYTKVNNGVIEKYYYGSDGLTTAGYQTIDGKNYYFYNNGKLYVGEKLLKPWGDKCSYVINSQGYATRLNRDGWTEADGSFYYCLDGKPFEDHVYCIENDYYGFDALGKMYVNKVFTSRNAYEDNSKWQIY